MTDPKIIAARNQEGGKWDPVKIFVTYEGAEDETYLRDFYDDEIYVNPMNLLGKTENEAREYIRQMDVAYLRS